MFQLVEVEAGDGCDLGGEEERAAALDTLNVSGAHGPSPVGRFATRRENDVGCRFRRAAESRPMIQAGAVPIFKDCGGGAGIGGGDNAARNLSIASRARIAAAIAASQESSAAVTSRRAVTRAALLDARSVRVPDGEDLDDALEIKLLDAESDARWELTGAVPTTMAGLTAMFAHVEGAATGKVSRKKDNCFDEESLYDLMRQLTPFLQP